MTFGLTWGGLEPGFKVTFTKEPDFTVGFGGLRLDGSNRFDVSYGGLIVDIRQYQGPPIETNEYKHKYMFLTEEEGKLFVRDR